MIVKFSEDTVMPNWLKESLDMNCTHCGSEMEHRYNSKNRCTGRRCSNPLCKGMQAMRLNEVTSRLNVAGVGPATCKTYLDNKTSFTEVLGKVIDKSSVKPINYTRAFELAMIEGCDEVWSKVVDNTQPDLDSVISKMDSKSKAIALANIEDVKRVVDFFGVRVQSSMEHEPVLYINIMMTGDFPGGLSKKMLVTAIMYKFKGLVNINLCGLRKTGINYLVKGSVTTVTGKIKQAEASSVPILSLNAFVEEIARRLTDLGASWD